MKSRTITINNKTYDSISQACRDWRVSRVALGRWIKKNGNKFKSGDLEIEVHE
jgi:hypothetical protein